MKTHSILRIAATLVSITLAAPAIAAPLTEGEMRAELLDKTLKGKRLGMSFVLQLRTDGSATMQSTIIDDDGKWRIQNGQMCLQWGNFRDGRENCSSFSREKDGFRLQGGPLLRVVGG